MQATGSFHRGLGTACGPCKRRKIRCDKPDKSQPCTRCQRKSLTCEPESPRDAVVKPRRAAKARRRGGTVTRDSSESADADTIELHSPQNDGQVPKDDILAIFYERGIHSLDWAVFSPNENPRLLYTGSQIASLHQLVRSEDGGQTVHYPFPQIKPPRQQKPDATQDASAAYLTAAASLDIAKLPPRDIRDSLINTYFGDIHPAFPIVDEPFFRSQYQDPNGPPPLLLLHCIFLAAARISTHPVVESSRRTLTAAIYRRAKMLYVMRHEDDRILLIQAALLLAWHVEDSDTVSNGPYYWIGQATRVAFGLGMHRDLSPSSPSLMPMKDRRIYRRVWWSLLRAEAYVALEYGRPAMIRVEDCDQKPLMDFDFEGEESFAAQSLNRRYCVLDAKISELALRMTSSITATGQRSWDDSIESELARLARDLPTSHDFLSSQLRITHSMVTLLLHRTASSPESTLIAQEAASAILTAFETMAAQGTIRRCTYFASTALLAAAVQFAQTIKYQAATVATMRALSSHAQLERILGPIQALAAYWPHLQAIHKLVSTIYARCTELINDDSLNGVDMQPSFDLDVLLSDYPFADFWTEMHDTDLRSAFDV